MRNNRFTQLALGMLCIGVLSTFAADQVISNRELGFEITFPEKWKIDKLQASADSDVPPGASSYVTTAVFSSEIAEGTTSKEFAAAYIKDKMSLEVGENIEVKLGDKIARKVTYKYSNDNIILVHYFITSGNRGFVLCIDWLKMNDKYFAKEIAAVVNSFKLIPQK